MNSYVATIVTLGTTTEINFGASSDREAKRYLKALGNVLESGEYVLTTIESRTVK